MSKRNYEELTEKSKKLAREAQEVTPLGVNSTFRFYEPYPISVERVEGTKVIDVDGNEYIDFSMNYGVQMVGHTHPKLTEVLKKQIEKGTLYTMPHESSTKFAEQIIDRFPVDKVRLTNSGTESTMHALRLARGFTGRDKIIKFAGCYHGVHDPVMASVSPVKEKNIVEKPMPISKGIPAEAQKNTLVATFNDIKSVDKLFERYKGKIAAVIIEPVQLNMGCVLPRGNFLQDLKKICNKEDALLIFDEIKTGAKVAWGGASEKFDIEPDIICLAKSIGGGLPVGAFAGREEVMNEIMLRNGVFHAGTYNANPLSVEAGLVTLRDILTKDAYRQAFDLSEKLADGYEEIIEENDLDAHIVRAGACGTIYFTEKPIRNHKDFGEFEEETNGLELAKKFWIKMLERGIIPHPRGLCDEQWTISVQHTEEDINRHLEAFRKVAPDLKEFQ